MFIRGLKHSTELATVYQFEVTLSRPDPQQAQAQAQEGGRGPRIYKIKLTKVAEINPE